MDFFFNLIRCTKNVGVVLLKTSDSGQTSQGSRKFISMNNTKIGNAPWQLPVTSLSVSKHQTVPRAVHRLESKCVFLNIESKHVVLVVLPVAGGFPELGVVHIWCNNFLVVTSPILLSEELKKGVVDASTVGQKETAPRTKLVEEKQLLLLYTILVEISGPGRGPHYTFPIFLWSRLAASSKNFLCSSNCFLSGKLTP